MKKLLYILLLLSTIQTFAQVTFQTTIHSGASENCNVDALHQISDQTYYVPETYVYTGDCANTGLHIHSYSVHLDISGNFTPAILRRFDFTYNRNKVVYIISGQRILIQDDITGDTLVHRVLPYNGLNYSFKKPTVDNYLIAVIPTVYNTDTLVKFDSTANLLYKKAYTKDTAAMMFYYFPTSDSGFYQVRDFRTQGTGGIVYRRQVVKYNTFLDSIWVKNINPDATIYQSPDYRLISIKQDTTFMKHITKFDDNLDTLLNVNYNDSIYWNIILPVKNGGIVSTSYNSTNTENTFGKVDSLGNTLWSRQLNPIDTSLFIISDLIQTKDEGFLLGGYHDIVPTGALECYIPKTTSVVMKIDSAGILTAIYEPLQNMTNIFSSPNPFSNEITLHSTQKGEAILFDLTGKEILRQKTFEGETKLNTEKLSSGFYVLHYFDGNTRANFKVTKQE